MSPYVATDESADAPVLVLGPVRLGDPARAVLDRVPVGLAASGTPSAILCTPSPWRRWWLADLVVAGERPGHHQAHAALLEHVRDAVARAGLQPAVGRLGEAEGVSEEVGRLGGVAHVELEMVDAVNRHPIRSRVVPDCGISSYVAIAM